MPQRVVSLSPSVTEIVFALGAGERLVGVSRYCDFPEEVSRLPRVGGFVDPDYETIVSLKPELVILLSSQRIAQRELEKLKIFSVMVPHRTVEDVETAILKIGRLLGVDERGRQLVNRIRSRAGAVRDAVTGLPRPRVMLCIGRSMSAPGSGPVYVAGKDGFYDRMIAMAGGENVCREERVAFPQLSAEGVIRLDPDVIVDLVNIQGRPTQSPGELVAQWQCLQNVKAVRTGKVFVLTDTRSLRPGPRYVEFLEQLVPMLHPELTDGKSSP